MFYPLTFGQVLPMRILQQVVLRSPFNIRPLIGVARHESAIGRGYFAWGYLVRFADSGEEKWRDAAEECLQWLIDHPAVGYGAMCWGDPYEYATRSGRRPRGAPLLIWSSLIGLAFLKACEVLQQPRYLEVARSIGNFILGLPREETSSGLCLSYVPYRQSSIHNSNAMGAAFLAGLAAVTGDRQMATVAAQAMEYTCARQRSDGGWFYAEDPKYHWIDGFHTGYNLSALWYYRSASGSSAFDDALRNGAK
jgi:hypothetical protein